VRGPRGADCEPEEGMAIGGLPPCPETGDRWLGVGSGGGEGGGESAGGTGVRGGHVVVKTLG
jgi:hypothetical protein